MADYSNTFAGAVKDGTQATILGADWDTEYSNIATAVNSKPDKVTGATGNLAERNASGEIANSGINSANLDGLDSNVETRLDALDAAMPNIFTPVTDHEQSAYVALWDGNSANTNYFEFGSFTTTSWSSIGGSTAYAAEEVDKEWTQLDNIIAYNPSALVCHVEIGLTTPLVWGTFYMYTAPIGITPNQDGGTQRAGVSRITGLGDYYQYGSNIIIPCNTDGQFQMSTSGGFGAYGRLYLQGFLRDG